MATLVLRNVKGSPLTNTEVDNNFSNINNELGVVSNLSTTAKANLVAAINEVFIRATSNVYATNVTVTGNITITGNAVLTTTPTANTHVVNKVYVDSQKTISNVAPVSVGSTSSGHVWYIY